MQHILLEKMKNPSSFDIKFSEVKKPVAQVLFLE